MAVPLRGPDGAWITLNKNLDDNQALWHLRSGWNVAALNCLDPAHEPILKGYGEFLKKYSRKLSSTNTALDAQYRKDLGSRQAGVQAREAFMTQVYNYFALPGARAGFCDASLAMANEFLAEPPADPVPFAKANLSRLESVFEQFFDAYEQYLVASAAWDTRYGAQYGASQPGYVAVHGTNLPTVAATLTDTGRAQLTAEITDPATGARIPLIAVPENADATPVVQPIATPQGQ